MPKAIVRDGTLTVALPEDIRERFDVHDGDELELTSERGRLVLTLAAEAPLPGEMDALNEAEAEFAQGKTHRLDDVLHGLGRKAG
ncbi:MAG TPA: AbrB/MazE/SpoVT family DNA-binding domain-containing protein [Stellaceae bacterium]|jgi:bifunctional DNA-binding transcriptional regulator/antitoxin component of YhaV-PrlF toxin-antitoxin module|nr:AbrB/MazE/SpoVT family DNA-binding domain-containing protein [Stellaceae bacterium]